MRQIIIVVRLVIVVMVGGLDRLVLLVGNVQTVKPRRPLLLPPRIPLARRHQLPHHQK
jgi:hypothetical protein